MNLKSIYQEVILDHNRKPRNYGTLDNANHHAVGHNPLCGDRIDLALHVEGEHIDRIAFHGESCAICKASASMMTATVKGKSRSEAETLITEFREMAVGNLDLSGPHHLGRLAVFAGVRDLPTRVKCAILPWHTLQAALNSNAIVSTETAEDSIHAANSKA
ncbi:MULTISPECIES: Fe-S cluster assembly sulfur transfer protein SufU [Nitrosomonas]|uniref:Nitrogen fixation NifU-like protein n=1 Tax=Nitrosomonas communis TaxID=44574 RepID=A0A0F7KD22_9PROT|nr:MULTISPECIES: SUF system NifU family Fe-S cluster assembly protein [Nitrosomonas]AKH36704.1 nitrogen fixation protein NifU [Nitrosomonas communis]TYP82854.1 nitrogen fixation NifU-like protein [Nitrosomonas communis]UVS61756.1 SUF system NifU family Fe-S cluster assembly protein [Nitrosomonas sp. PLL12]